jgi:histone deacetylase HOS3
MDSLESGGSDSRPSKGDEKNERPGLQIFYASIHDILSYPCEDGVAELVQAASVSISGQHGQFIENIHLQPYSTHEEFWEKLYTQRYSKIFDKAKAFLQSQPENTGDNHANKVGTGWDRNVPIFISCGFDASELEYESMSRHGRKVPVGFYYRFTRDACRFAEEYANGKVVSVLEGGYSDRTLTAGGMAHLVGLVEDDKIEVNEDVNVNPLDISELGGNVRLGETNNEVVREGKLKLEAVSGGPEDWWSDRNLELVRGSLSEVIYVIDYCK